jgi:membrane-associated protein
MGSILTWISDKLLLLHGPAALAVVFLLPALEASVFLGFLVPGEIAVVIGGYLAFNHTVSFAAVLAAAILGAVIGDSIGYSVGKRWGDLLLTRLPKRFVKPEHIDQGKELINRLGGRAVFAGRFAAALRAIVPGLCGVSRLPYRKFLLWNVLGGAVWATGFTLLGYAAGNAWHRVEHAASLVSWVFLGLVVVAVAVMVIIKKRKGRTDHDVPDAETTEPGADVEAEVEGTSVATTTKAQLVADPAADSEAGAAATSAAANS